MGLISFKLTNEMVFLFLSDDARCQRCHGDNGACVRHRWRKSDVIYHVSPKCTFCYNTMKYSSLVIS